jgi:mRNA interferase MazF
MRRGDVVLVDFEPARGSEANKRRPAVVVSNDGANVMAERRGRGVVTVVPLSSNVARVFAFQLALPAEISGLKKDSKAQAEQVRAVDVERVLATVGRLPAAELSELDDRLRLHLAL